MVVLSPKAITLDLETTGLPVKIVAGKRAGTTRKQNLDYKTEFKDFPYIVSWAWKINDGETREFLIFQEGREIPKEASDIHGITSEIGNDPDKTKPLAVVLMLFLADCADNHVCIGYNMYFDTSIIKANVLRLIDQGVFKPEAFDLVEKVLCKFKRVDVMRAIMPMTNNKWLKLTDAHEQFLNAKFDAHSAKNDVDATKRIYNKLYEDGKVPTAEELQKRKEEAKDGTE